MKKNSISNFFKKILIRISKYSLVKKIYLKNIIIKTYVKYKRLDIDKPILNPNGIKGVYIVSSYTNNDEPYLKGMIKSCEAFEKIILFHDKKISHNFDYNESIRFQLLVASAIREGANWVLIASPKTRFSKQFKSQIQPLIDEYTGTPTVIVLKERYLWEDFEHYANPKIIDNDIFIEKFFSITENMIFDNKYIHAKQCPINYSNKVSTEASRYYLGRFNIKMMKKKANIYSKLDNGDYSYMYQMNKPIKHNEKILGIGDFEINELLAKKN